MSKAVKILKHFETPSTEGTYHRLLCLNGQAKGTAYFIEDKRIILGRGEKADIKVLDQKSSREHAEITLVGNDYIITDLGSQNGILVNDQKVKQQRLKDGDKVTIGQVIYKFNRVDVRGQSSAKPEKKEGKPGILLFIIAGAIGLMFFSGDETVNAPSKKSERKYNFNEVSDDFEKESKKKREDDKRLKKQLNAIFQRGLRELREGNYYRAMSEFDHAISMNPNDKLAEFYLNKTKEALADAVDQYVIKANRDSESLKHLSAANSYCSITRLLYFNKDDERYKKAIEEIGKIEEKLGMDKGEINCSQK